MPKEKKPQHPEDSVPRFANGTPIPDDVWVFDDFPDPDAVSPEELERLLALIHGDKADDEPK